MPPPPEIYFIKTFIDYIYQKIHNDASVYESLSGSFVAVPQTYSTLGFNTKHPQWNV